MALILIAANDPLAALLPIFVLVVFFAIVLRKFGPRYPGSKLQLAVKDYVRRYFVLGCLALFAFAATVYCGGGLAMEANVDLEADMWISDGDTISAYINDWTVQPMRLSIAPKSRRVYRFEHIPTNLTSLRIDPSGVRGARISIYSLAVMAEGREVRRFTPDELKSWTLHNLTITPGDAAALNLTSMESDAFLTTNVSLVASNRAAWLLYVLDIFRTPHLSSLVLFSFFLLFLLGGLSRAEGMIDAALVAAVALVAYPAAMLATKIPVPSSTVVSSVSKASYLGYPKLHDHLASFILLAVSVVFSWIAARYIPRPTLSLASEAKVSPKPKSFWRTILVPATLLAWLGSLYLPDLSGILNHLKQLSFQPGNWDVQNFVLWNYLVHKGHLPFRDFWYPYSGFYTFTLGFPLDPLITTLQEVLTLFFLYLGLRFTIALDRMAAFVVFLILLLSCWNNEFAGWYRYLLAVSVALFYVALRNTHRIEWSKQIGLALTTGFVFFFEPTQLIYAGTGIAAHTLFACLPKPGTPFRPATIGPHALSVIRQRLVYIGVPMVVGVLPVLAFLGYVGILPGFLSYQLHLSDQTYAAWPTDVAEWTLPVLRFEAMFLLLFLALALALYRCFVDRDRTPSTAVGVLVVGLAGFMAIQKQIVRPPGMDQQVQVYPWVAVLLYGLSAWPRRTKLQSGVIAVFLGVIFGVAEYSGEFQRFYRAMIQTPSALARDYNVVFHRNLENRIANATEYHPARFARFVDQKSVIEVLKSEFGWSQPQTVYVLGDDPIFYVLLGGDFPFVANNYNCSPINLQQRVLQWLKDRKPRFIIWNPSVDSYDGVPHVVRLPLIYQFVAENYTHARTVGSYHILMMDTERPGADDQYWKKQLGTGIDLGSIPRLTDAGDYRECPQNGGVPCQQVLFVDLPRGTSPGKAAISIDTSSGPFQVAFDVVGSAHEYIVDLDRLWFRRLIAPHAHAILSAPGGKVDSATRLRKEDVLY